MALDVGKGGSTVAVVIFEETKGRVDRLRGQ